MGRVERNRINDEIKKENRSIDNRETLYIYNLPRLSTFQSKKKKEKKNPSITFVITRNYFVSREICISL